METILNFLIEVINNNWKEEVNKKISSQICSCFSLWIYIENISVWMDESFHCLENLEKFIYF